MQTEPIRSVLLVDDEELVCELLCRWLVAEGYCCRAVQSASDALAALAAESFDLLFLDINMPEITGIEILKEVRPLYPDLGIIMATGVDDRDIALSALTFGADGYLNKPINRLELILSAANAIMRHQLARQNRQQQDDLALLVADKTKELKEAYDALRQSHEQIMQQEKMAAIGQLAAGVAHEINNPTGFIASNLGTLDKYLSRLAEFIAQQAEVIAAHADTESLARHDALRQKMKIDHILRDGTDLINESKEGTERIKNIVQGLKNFSRKDQENFCLTDINNCLESTLNIVWNELKYKATVVKDFGELPETMCYPQQLNQVFVNLLVNAAQALIDMGEIRIRAWAEDGSIFIAISDNGPGIPEAIRHRLFEPFFTTKELGKGTGLGLSISSDIIKKHGGEITIDSEVGRGATFTIQIPVCGKNETVLKVE